MCQPVGKRPAGLKRAFKDSTTLLVGVARQKRNLRSSARRRRDPSVKYNDPLNASLVPPLQRPNEESRA
jgi:hypothetical protein